LIVFGKIRLTRSWQRLFVKWQPQKITITY
jgi:hypothetical protein